MKRISFAFVLLLVALITVPHLQAFSQKPVKITEIKTPKSFDKTIKNSKKLVLVDFWAEWCGPCRMIAPNVEEMAQEMKDKLVVAKYDLGQDGAETIVRRYRIEAIPLLIVFEKGKEVGRHVGYMSKEDLRAWLSNYVK